MIAIRMLLIGSLTALAGLALGQTVHLWNDRMAIGIECDATGATLTSLFDPINSHEYLSYPTFLFEFSVNNGPSFQSNNGLIVQGVSTIGHESATIDLYSPSTALSFRLDLHLGPSDDAIQINTHVTNSWASASFLRMVMPKIHGLRTNGIGDNTMGMIPQEIGAVSPLHVAPPGAPITSIRRNSDQTDTFFIGNDGAVWTTFQVFNGPWSMPMRISRPGLAPPGGTVAAIMQNALVEDVFVAGNNGAIYVISQNNASGWSPAAPITPEDSTVPGGGLAVVMRSAFKEDLLYVGLDGAVRVITEDFDGPFSNPVLISTTDYANPGAQITAARRSFYLTDALIIGNEGQIAYSSAYVYGEWSLFDRITEDNVAPMGASLACVNSGDNDSDVFFVGLDGALSYLYLQDTPDWRGPEDLTLPATFFPGSYVSACVRNESQVDAFVVGYDGALWTAWLFDDSPYGPLPITGPYLAPVSGGVASVMQTDTQQNAFVIGNSGTPWLTFEGDNGPWAPAVPIETTLGMPLNMAVGLPTAMNSMEVASLYDAPTGSGIFFAGVGPSIMNGGSPIQFTLSSTTLAGFFTAELAPSEEIDLPRVDIGMHATGDWHHAVDYYRSANWSHNVDTGIPSWLREAGAIYSFSGAGAGGILMSYPPISLKDHLVNGSFTDLGQLLDEAEDLGTNVVYVWDYWQGTELGGQAAYFNKGNYEIRTDMGGPAAFEQGIQDIHGRGGKVIVYLESFIAYHYSLIGQSMGPFWGARRRDGSLDTTYENNYSLIPASQDWQDWLISIALNLVLSYDVDGIFLDSAGWQMNLQHHNLMENYFYTSQEYSRGVLELTERLRSILQTVKPEAVVLGETTSGQMDQVWDGGLSADLGFSWLREANQGRIVASPVRYGDPSRLFFGNGQNLYELNQIFAAGQPLVLCNNGVNSPPSFMKDSAPYIKRLVEIRRSYKDCFVYGEQVYQPNTGNPDVAAYLYQGASRKVITVANTSGELPYVGTLTLRAPEARKGWRDLLTGQTFFGKGSSLEMDLPPGGLRVLVPTALSIIKPR